MPEWLYKSMHLNEMKMVLPLEIVMVLCENHSIKPLEKLQFREFSIFSRGRFAANETMRR